LAASEITPAAVRLYARAIAIEGKVEDAIADGDHMTTEELLAWSKRLLKGKLNLEAEEARAKAALLAQHREYQWVKTELSRQLGLGPDDPSPLDPDLFDREWNSPDDPRIKPWKRALELTHRLSVTHMTGCVGGGVRRS
jgi:hypothetical protein